MLNRTDTLAAHPDLGVIVTRTVPVFEDWKGRVHGLCNLRQHIAPIRGDECSIARAEPVRAGLAQAQPWR